MNQKPGLPTSNDIMQLHEQIISKFLLSITAIYPNRNKFDRKTSDQSNLAKGRTAAISLKSLYFTVGWRFLPDNCPFP